MTGPSITGARGHLHVRHGPLLRRATYVQHGWSQRPTIHHYNARPPAWNPCVSKQGEPYSTVWKPLRCEGRYLLWEINGVHWADCRAYGFSGCAGGRCVR